MYQHHALLVLHFKHLELEQLLKAFAFKTVLKDFIQTQQTFVFLVLLDV